LPAVIASYSTCRLRSRGGDSTGYVSNLRHLLPFRCSLLPFRGTPTTPRRDSSHPKPLTNTFFRSLRFLSGVGNVVRYGVEQCAVLDAVKYKGRRPTLAWVRLGHVPSAEYSNCPRVCSIPLPPPMSDPNNNIRGSESVTDEEKGQGTDLSFIHNRVVLTLFCRKPQLPTQYDTFPARSRPSGRVQLFRWF
jgi:hypothetical protein